MAERHRTWAPQILPSLQIYRRLVGARVRAQWSHRTSFATFLLAQSLVTATDLGAILAVFSRVPALGGWSVAEVVVLFGVTTTAFGLADVFTSQVEECARHVQEGSFDQFLLRPYGVLAQLSAVHFELRRVGRGLLTGPLATAAGFGALGRLPGPDEVLLLLVAVLAGAVTFGSLFVAGAAATFRVVGAREVANAFTYGGATAAQYPTHVFDGWLRRFILFVVPIGVVGYLPVLEALDAADPLGVPAPACWLAPVAAAGVSAAFASAVWRSALRFYQGTGS